MVVPVLQPGPADKGREFVKQRRAGLLSVCDHDLGRESPGADLAAVLNVPAIQQRCHGDGPAASGHPRRT